VNIKATRHSTLTKFLTKEDIPLECFNAICTIGKFTIFLIELKKQIKSKQIDRNLITDGQIREWTAIRDILLHSIYYYNTTGDILRIQI